MSKIYETNLDLNKNELQNAVLQVLGANPSTPSLGQTYFNSGSNKIRTYNGATWDAYSAGGNTNLSFSRDGTTVTVESDTGTDAILPTATGALAGVLSAADKTKLDAITGSNTGDEPDSSLTVKGIIEIATQAEVDAGTDAVRAAAPDTLQVKIDAEIAAALTTGMDFKGDYNASTNTPDLDTAPSGVLVGDTYVVSAAGTFFTEDVQIGDSIIARQDSPTTLAHWVVVNKNIPDIVSASETAEGIIELATQAEVDTGTDAVRAVTPATLQSKLGVSGTLNNAVRFTQQIGNAAATDIVVTHNIGRQFLTAQVFQTSTPFAQIECDIEMDTATATSFTFTVAPTSNQYTVVITG